MLYCSNYTCQTLNPETNKFCQKCRTPLTKNYLWAIGDTAIQAYQPGDRLADRYLCKAPRIFLDTKPGLPPATIVEELLEAVVPYLRLSPYRIHVPQVYDLLRLEQPNQLVDIVLLDQAAIYDPVAIAKLNPALDQTNPVQLLPTLTSVWQQASALRQLHWLWQMAHLWGPFSAERVSSSLLLSDLLRVEGPLIRLLELQSDVPTVDPDLSDLGQLWSQWITGAQPQVAPFLEQLCQQLIQGQIQNEDALITQLDEAIRTIDRGQQRQVEIVTQTDRGPTRPRNEDACYPPGGSHQTQILGGDRPPGDIPLVVVCDGIGGHQGGDVASNLAIATIQQAVRPLALNTLSPFDLMEELGNSVSAANDQISQRNDDEQRQERQRMGTTVVMGLAWNQQLYLTHVGDSRAYWITRWGCRQVTLDDDVASREVRMGYNFYRDALQHPSSGSLVQALGMGASSMLRPNTQRFILDEDSVFLLCSDGLSDNDRVDECWETEILPLLEGKTDAVTVSKRLVEIANTRNGHDNVTIGLIHCRLPNASPPALVGIPQTAAIAPPTRPERVATPSTLKTRLVPSRTVTDSGKLRLLPLLLSTLILLGLGGAIAYFLSLPFRNWVDAQLGMIATDPTPSLSPSSPGTGEALSVGSFIQVGRSPDSAAPPLVLLPQPPVPNSSPNPSISPAPPAILPGSLLKVEEERLVGGDRWLKLQICSSGSPAPPAVAPTEAPASNPSGWVKTADIEPLALTNQAPTAAELGSCVGPTPAPDSSPPPVNPTPPPPTATPAG